MSGLPGRHFFIFSFPSGRNKSGREMSQKVVFSGAEVTWCSDFVQNFEKTEGNVAEAMLELSYGATGDTFLKWALVKTSVGDFRSKAEDRYIFDNGARCARSEDESFRDYVVASLTVNRTVKVAVGRVVLRGMGKSQRTETVLTRYEGREFGHTQGWYRERWPARLHLDIKLSSDPVREYEYSGRTFNCHAERRLLKDVFNPEDQLYAHMYCDNFAGSGLTLFGAGHHERLLMMRPDVYQCTRENQKVAQRVPGMLILTNLRLIFFAYRTANQVELAKRFEKLDDEASGLGQVSYLALLGSIKEDLPLLLERMALRSSRNRTTSTQLNVTDSVTKRDTSLPALDMQGMDFVEEEVLDDMAYMEGSQKGNDLVEAMSRIFKVIDNDGNGLLTLSEFLFAIDASDDGDDRIGVESLAARRSFELPIGSIQNLSHSECNEVGTNYGGVRLAKIVAVDVIGHEPRHGVTYFEIVVRGEASELEGQGAAPFRSSWSTWHRFSEFESLNQKMVPILSTSKITPSFLPKLPPKFNLSFNGVDIAERQRSLSTYLQQLCRLEEAWTEALMDFLDPPNNLGEHYKFETLLQEIESMVKTSTPVRRRMSSGTAPSHRPQLNSPSPATAVVDVQGVSTPEQDPMSPLMTPPISNRQSRRTSVARLVEEQQQQQQQQQQQTEDDLLALLARAQILDNEDRSVSRADVPQRIKLLTADGRRFYFRVGHSGVGSLQACRRGCDGSLSSGAWCSKLEDEVQWMLREDEFALTVGSAYQDKISRDEAERSSCGAQTDKIQSTPTRVPQTPQGRQLTQASSSNFLSVRSPGNVVAKFVADFERESSKKNRPNGSDSDDEESLSMWRKTELNEKWELCDSYPKALYVPHSLPDEELNLAAPQRSRERIPTLTYLHRENGAPICRSSQPRGRGALHHDDNVLLNIYRANPRKYGKQLHVVDARSWQAATANAIFKGKGSENLSRLGNSFFVNFMDIDNIHAMRHSLDGLGRALAEDDDDHCMSAIDNTQWIHHAVQLLRGSVFVARTVENGNSVLIHCSDGWDRTSQLCALAQVLLNPAARTINGFAEVIDKDFGHFGHGYDMRTAPLNASGSERSPVFFQFLDAVHHLLVRFPRAFEFNELFLRIINKGYHSRCFLNFVGNYAKDRVNAVDNFTWRMDGNSSLSGQQWPTLWVYLRAFIPVEKFQNLMYDPHSIVGALSPCLDERAYKLWDEHFLRNLPQLVSTTDELSETQRLRRIIADMASRGVPIYAPADDPSVGRNASTEAPVSEVKAVVDGAVCEHGVEPCEVREQEQDQGQE